MLGFLRVFSVLLKETLYIGLRYNSAFLNEWCQERLKRVPGIAIDNLT